MSKFSKIINRNFKGGTYRYCSLQKNLSQFSPEAQYPSVVQCHLPIENILTAMKDTSEWINHVFRKWKVNSLRDLTGTSRAGLHPIQLSTTTPQMDALPYRGKKWIEWPMVRHECSCNSKRFSQSQRQSRKMRVATRIGRQRQSWGKYGWILGTEIKWNYKYGHSML